VLMRALRSQVQLDVTYTEYRGHGLELARQAAIDGVDLVVVLGGDGAVNEVVNGLLTYDDEPTEDRADQRPALAVVPGGSTNVFARALGLPGEWSECTGIILEALREGRTRRVGMGRADQRYFTFCAGLGIDAEVINRVEQHRRRGSTSTPALYLRAATAQYTTVDARRKPSIVLEQADGSSETELSTVIIQNTVPWTYVGDRAIHCCPQASFDLGLDLFAIRQMRLGSAALTAARLFGGRPIPPGKQALHLHDLPSFTLRSATPIAFQLDGEYLGEREKLRFAAIPNALRIVC
jgi:diacylglycerol kinase family enzyme